jgi:YgiT-type zinc finger domain-containing protein
MSEAMAQAVPCPRCEGPMRPAIVRTDIWQGDRLSIVEDIPAQVCDSCVGQYYNEDVTDALRRLVEDGFPAAEIKREMVVPVFSLTARIRVRTTQSDYEDY